MNKAQAQRVVLSRSSWFDAQLAIEAVRNGQAVGRLSTLQIRARVQKSFYELGAFVQQNAGLVLFMGLLLLISSSIGLKSVSFENNIENLWVERGGRLDQELDYVRKTIGDGFGNTNQILIQTPKNERNNILRPRSLLLHLELMKVATQVTVELFDISWKLKDICYSLSPPDIEEYNVFQIIEKLLPCAIITPLDCFWEGSKLLGPEDDIQVPGLGYMRWTSLNPRKLVENLNANFGDVMHPSVANGNRFSMQSFLETLKRGGISSAYQDKYCLDPTDEECPASAPNKNNGQLPDVGSVLTGGCHGFASKWMHWPEALVVGGIAKNKSGQIVRAGALQSIIQLMSDQDLFEYYQNHFKVISIDWNLEKARQVLEAWQRKLFEEIQQFQANGHAEEFNVHQFTSVALMDIMRNFNTINVTKLGIAISLLLVHFVFVLADLRNSVKSATWLSVPCLLLLLLAACAGFGCCALLGLTFNANTTQIVPFVVLGLVSLQMHWMLQTYGENLRLPYDRADLIARLLQQTGFSQLMATICMIICVCAAAVMPIPALRNFVYQLAILIVYGHLSVFLLLPALLALDLKRQETGRSDYLNCFGKQVLHTSSAKPHQGGCELTINNSAEATTRREISLTNANQELVDGPRLEMSSTSVGLVSMTDQHNWSLRGLVFHFYAPFLQQKLVRLLVLVGSLIFSVYCGQGLSRVQDGLDLTDIVPRNTDEYRFLSAQKQHFSVFNMFIVTKGNFDYANNQRLLIQFHRAFDRVSSLIKDENGSLPDFWLHMFRDWLHGLQNSFEREFQSGCVHEDGWHRNASADAILAYKLLVQTGRVDRPVDRRLISKKRRLVDEQGLINARAFYNYLTAWVSNDALTYSASQAIFRPEPKQWMHEPNDLDLRVPKAQPLAYAQMPFLLSGLDSTENILKTIGEIRAICAKYEEKGLYSFPSGLPFVFWEQYVRLRCFFYTGVGIALIGTGLFCSLLLGQVCPSLLLMFTLALMQMQMFGLMGHLNIPLNAVPAVILLLVNGLGASNLIHMTISFLTCMGKRRDRMASALEHVCTPLFHGLTSLSIGVSMLLFSEFDFIFRYFFHVLCTAIVLNLLNVFCFYPVLLGLLGPVSDVESIENLPHLPLSEPPPSLLLNQRFLNLQRRQQPKTSCFNHKERRSNHGSRSIIEASASELGSQSSNECRNSDTLRKSCPRAHSQISLSTISEEPHDYTSSREIIVPQLVLKTTTSNAFYPQHCRPGTGCNKSNVEAIKTPTCESSLATERRLSLANTDCESLDSRETGASSSASSYSRCCSAGGRYFSTPPSQYCNLNNGQPTPPPIYTAHPTQYANNFQFSHHSTMAESQTDPQFYTSTVPTSTMTNDHHDSQFINHATTTSNDVHPSTNVNDFNQLTQPIGYTVYQPQSSYTSNLMASENHQPSTCHSNFVACNNFKCYTTKITATAKLTVELPQKPNRFSRAREPSMPPSRNG